jgi:phage baseplate assembly protein W
MDSLIFDLNKRYGLVNDYRVALRDENESISNMIISVIETPIGSRLFNRDYGSRVYELLHNNISAETASDILHEILVSVNRNVSKAALVSNLCEIVPDYDNMAYRMKLAYRQVITNEIVTFDKVLFVEDSAE